MYTEDKKVMHFGHLKIYIRETQPSIYNKLINIYIFSQKIFK